MSPFLQQNCARVTLGKSPPQGSTQNTTVVGFPISPRALVSFREPKIDRPIKIIPMTHMTCDKNAETYASLLTICELFPDIVTRSRSYLSFPVKVEHDART